MGGRFAAMRMGLPPGELSALEVLRGEAAAMARRCVGRLTAAAAVDPELRSPDRLEVWMGGTQPRLGACDRDDSASAKRRWTGASAFCHHGDGDWISERVDFHGGHGRAG